MKKLLTLLLAVIITFTFSACTGTSESSTSRSASTASQQSSIAETTISKSEEMKIRVIVGDKAFSATLENSEAAKELYDLIKKEGLTVSMSDYSGFEKVGALGKTLTSNDKQTTTEPGDIVLYQSNQIVMFYGSNSWSYTRLGKIDDLSGWEEALGDEDITAVFTLSK